MSPEPTPWDAPGVLIVTGTDTDVGKTVATAVLASALVQRGLDIAVCKPAQTGVAPGEDADVAQVGHLAGLPPERLHEFVRLPEPLAPTTAGRRAGIPLPPVAEHARRIADLATTHEVVLVEGAGGILVGLDAHGAGLLELADALVALGVRPRFVVVARSGLGTLNHTGLTCRAITDCGFPVTGVVVGSWPESPDLAERCNLDELDAVAASPVLAVLPAGLGDRPDLVHLEARKLP